MHSVLVTGGSGFIGSQTLAPLAARGFRVHVASRRIPSTAAVSHDITFHKCDLDSPEQVWRLLHETRPTHLLHLAWYAEHGRFWTSPKNLDCVAASLTLFRAFAECGGKRIVAAGTCAEYDWTTGAERFAESSPVKPHTLYGRAKDSLRAILEQWSTGAGLSSAWGRVFLLYGPGEDERRLVPSIAGPLAEGGIAKCLCGTHVRDFLHVNDVAAAFAALVDSAVTGPVNVSSGEGIELGQVARLLAGPSVPAGRLQIEQRPFTPENPQHIVGDATRLRDEVGWRPSRTLEQGLDEFRNEMAYRSARPAA
jgi:nucleoside-diphosphate-sugar epimerase